MNLVSMLIVRGFVVIRAAIINTFETIFRTFLIIDFNEVISLMKHAITSINFKFSFFRALLYIFFELFFYSCHFVLLFTA